MSPLEDSGAFGLGLDLAAPARYYPASRSVRSRAGAATVRSGEQWATRYHLRLCISDATVLTSVAIGAQIGRFGFGNPDVSVGQFGIGYGFLSLGIAAAWMLALGIYGSRDARVVGIGSDEYKRVISATTTLLGLLAITFLVFKIDIARGYFALAVPLGVGGLIASRWALRNWLMRQRAFGHYLSRVIVLGRHKDVRYVINQIQKKSGAAYHVVGAALPGSDPRLSVVVGPTAVPVVSTIDSVVDAVRRFEADAVIVAGPLKGGSDYIQKLGWRLEESRTELVLATGLTNVAGPRIHSRPVEGLPLMHVELPQYAGAKHVVKRLLDVVLSGCALLVLAPLFLVLAVLIRRDSPGPVLFRQERIGRAGEKFVMFKFRSMVVTAEEELAGLLERNEGAGLLFKMKDDPRVTTTGEWLRRYSLDELPQLWNVLRGDMSLVGPRPPLQREVDGYKDRVHRRLYIKPGLTGMWQINGRSALNWQDSVRLDLYYVENWSLTGDLIILWRTARMLKNPVGAY
ncbi:sugar transferase [Paenarthrobacter sp. PH39-S1]|uniref:sugar transferase n=1 Tax=Paenarthrobacter sp. PH39-S1 TaxID=3046204 RepID=UPI0024B8E7A5|nr:sugar transferase [Paenarthrobacter sp. PH39-S1]MDJ0356127.1 sugar transferase [Paenarthrobacter sp. PH39-S1]